MSEFLRRSFITDYGINPAKVVCIGAGINVDLPSIEWAKDYSKASILFIGVNFARKGGYDVLKAFRIVRDRIPHATLHIVGPHDRRADVAEMDGMVWHGFLDKDNETDARTLARLLREATVFAMPSLYEPFGIAPLEAMAYGIPCVSSNAWALPEIVPDRICGRLVEPGDHEQLAEVLTEMLRDPALLEQYGRAGRKHVEGNYTWPKVVERLSASLSANRVVPAA
jgi:glycosyltransferase involved in cell wall biosynthesis